MLKQHLVMGLVGAALLATPVFAQSTMSTTAPANAAASAQWRSSKLVGVNVFNNNNEKIGDIADMLVDKDGKITNVILGVGGFLGMGEHDVAVAFDKLKFSDEPVKSNTASNSSTTTTSRTTTGSSTTTTTTSNDKKWYPDHAVFDATKDQLKAMPEFKF